MVQLVEAHHLDEVVHEGARGEHLRQRPEPRWRVRDLVRVWVRVRVRVRARVRVRVRVRVIEKETEE